MERRRTAGSALRSRRQGSAETSALSLCSTSPSLSPAFKLLLYFLSRLKVGVYVSLLLGNIHSLCQSHVICFSLSLSDFISS